MSSVKLRNAIDWRYFPPVEALIMNHEDLETLDRFEDWLRSHPPTAIVGQAATACSCPLANWGEALLDSQTYVEEGVFYADVAHQPLVFNLTEICERFVAKIDAFFDDEITAREAIEILQECRWELDSSTLGGWG
jgi:hypothetical protein